MPSLLAWILVGVAGVYGSIGLVFALFFTLRGVGRIDPAASEGTIGFRIAIFPGVVALWPLLMRRLQEGSPPPEEHNAHRDLTHGEDVAATRPVSESAR